MKRRWIVLLLLAASPASASAQDGEGMLGMLYESTWRGVRVPAADVGGVPTEGQFNRVSAGLRGGEGMLRGGGAGIYLRSLSGTFPTRGGEAGGDVSLRDARVLIGTRMFGFEFGYHRQGYGTETERQTANFWRGGGRAHLDLGPSGLGVFLAGSLMMRIDDGEEAGGASFPDNLSLAGSEGETGLIYQAPKGLPLFARVGYRFARSDVPIGGGLIQEEARSGVIVSVGIRWVSPEILR